MHGNKRCILVADDEPKMVYALRDFLTANSFSVIEAFDGEDALEKYWTNSKQIDLILLDAIMPKENGIDVLKELRESACMVPIIMLAPSGADDDEINGLNSGADDYIQKPFSPTALLEKVEKTLRRFGITGDRDVIAGRIRIDMVRHSAYVDDEEIDVTRREYDLLLFFMNNPQITFTREQLINRVWGYDFVGTERTVDAHIKQLRVKLKDCADYIETIHCVGYRFQVN